MNKNMDLGFMTMGFVINAVVSRSEDNTEDCIFQLGQAKGMWFALKVLGFDIEQMKDFVIEQASKEEFMPVANDAKIAVGEIIRVFESVHKDTIEHIDQIVGGMLLNEAQQ